MLLPAEWRVTSSPGFDAEFSALEEEGARTGAIMKGWRFYLSRDPMNFSYGLTREDDDVRVIYTVDPRDGAEYFAGLWVDRTRQTVVLTWAQRREVE